MMRKSFLLKTIFLVMLLVAVLLIIITTMSVNFGYNAAKAAKGQTLLEQFVISGGPIVWFILLPMSLVMVYLAVEYSLTIRRKKLLPDGIGSSIIQMTRQLDAGSLETRFNKDNDFISKAIARAITKGRSDWFRMRNLLFESLQEQALGLVRKTEWINLIGNVSPMIGLFGTVFGMIKLFNAIVTAGGQPQPAQLAEGISVALVTTFWGLFIAIPALAIYGVFQNRIETIHSDAVMEAENILPQIKLILEKQKQAEPHKGQQTIAEIHNKSAQKIAEPTPIR